MIFLGLGSNIGQREANITAAITQLSEHPCIKITKTSSLYETRPVGFCDQPDFLNAVIEIDTSLSPEKLLDTCLSIELGLGRIRDIHWGPRIIDIDLLLFHDSVVQSDRLVLPHPRLHERSFVLVPLAEIAPETIIYEGNTAKDIIDTCPTEGVIFYKQLAWEVK